MSPNAALQVGICGTFDVENYGDLLFPLIAEVELTKRLGPIDLHRFSYFSKSRNNWPFDVSPLAELPLKVQSLDGILIGGGHLIDLSLAASTEVLPGLQLWRRCFHLHKTLPYGLVLPRFDEGLIDLFDGVFTHKSRLLGGACYK
jgi:hypothetical protein